MSFDASTAAVGVTSTAAYAGYGASLTDALQFHNALSAASSAAPPPAAGGGSGGLDALQKSLSGVTRALESVNGEAVRLGRAADAAQARGTQLSPGEMVMLTMRCQEFMFHCQLTSNIANRTSDGLQQLFRQQG